MIMCAFDHIFFLFVFALERIFIVTVHTMSSYTKFINEASREAKENCSRIFLNDNVGVANNFLYRFWSHIFASFQFINFY